MRAMQAGFSSCRYGNKTQCDGMLWSTSDTTDPLVIYSVMQGFRSGPYDSCVELGSPSLPSSLM